MITISDALCFDDVLLKPKHFNGNSRSEIDLTVKMGDFTFKNPLISANMSSITEDKTAIAMAECGGLGIIHRFQSIEDQCKQIKNVSNKGYVVGGSIGINKSWKEDVIKLLKSGVNIICLDIAHADQIRAFNLIKAFKKEFPNELLIAGNVATSDAIDNLSNLGADVIKIGVGGGSVCSTRIKTGCGVPTLQSLLDIDYYTNTKYNLIADGGIKNSGDCVKSLAAGALFVMIGSLLAGCDECPGEIVLNNKGKHCKVYKGSASVNQKQSFLGKVDYIEGEETLIPCKGSMYEIIYDLVNGIKSGFSYCGAMNLNELQKDVEFIKITSAGYHESTPHGVK